MGRHPTTVARWGLEDNIPLYVVSFLTSYEAEQKTKRLAYLLDSESQKQCPNGHELEAWLQIRNNCIVCGFCGAIVQRNIYPQGE